MLSNKNSRKGRGKRTCVIMAFGPQNNHYSCFSGSGWTSECLWEVVNSFLILLYFHVCLFSYLNIFINISIPEGSHLPFSFSASYEREERVSSCVGAPLLVRVNLPHIHKLELLLLLNAKRDYVLFDVKERDFIRKV